MNDTANNFDLNTIPHNPRVIAIIAKWIPEFGKTIESAKNVESQWFVMDIITREQFFNNMEEINDTLEFYKKNYRGKKEHIKLALIEPYLLPTKEIIAIDHTSSLNLFKRLWKNKK